MHLVQSLYRTALHRPQHHPNCVRIRTHVSRDGVFKPQLNLDDLLDAVISMLPDNAYTQLLLVEHDLFESVDDEFVCGRAYGGSRVAVISSAGYHALLYEKQDAERHHAWPASHCEAYMQSCRTAASQPVARSKRKLTAQNAASEQPGPRPSSVPHLALPSTEHAVLPPLQAALSPHRALCSPELSVYLRSRSIRSMAQPCLPHRKSSMS